MFQYSYNQIKEVYAKNISYVNDDSYTVIMSDTKGIGSYRISDIILVFSPHGELVIFAERVYKENYSILERIKNLFTAILSVDISKKEVNTTVTLKRKYTDVVKFKRWWYEWAKELL